MNAKATTTTQQAVKFAVPVNRDQGLDSRGSSHFGRAPGFLTLFSDGYGLQFHDSRSTRQASECAPITTLVAANIRFVAAKSMGRGALERCHQAGLQIFHTQVRTVNELLLEIQRGSLVDFPDDALCNHKHDEGHFH